MMLALGMGRDADQAHACSSTYVAVSGLDLGAVSPLQVERGRGRCGGWGGIRRVRFWCSCVGSHNHSKQ